MCNYIIYVYIFIFILIEQGQTALISASFKGHTETVKLLLEKGADVDIKNKDVGYYI